MWGNKVKKRNAVKISVEAGSERVACSTRGGGVCEGDY